VVTATRRPEQFGMPDVKSWIAFGASPRASLGIIAASRALALVRGRDYVVPQDVIEVIPDVLRHRLVLTYDALADDVKAETVINRILQTVGLPQVNAIPQQSHNAAPQQVPPVPPAAPAAAGASGR
jgi:MoxR-like ATPase